MALINQNKHVSGEVLRFQPLHRIEFVYDACHHIRLGRGHQLHKMPPAGCACRIELCMRECGGNLTVQLLAVRYDDDTRMT